MHEKCLRDRTFLSKMKEEIFDDKNHSSGVSTFHNAMVDFKSQPLLLRLILFLIGEDVENWILPYLFRIQTAKVIVHKRFNRFVNVINYALQFMVFIRIHLNVEL